MSLIEKEIKSAVVGAAHPMNTLTLEQIADAYCKNEKKSIKKFMEESRPALLVKKKEAEPLTVLLLEKKNYINGKKIPRKRGKK